MILLTSVSCSKTANPIPSQAALHVEMTATVGSATLTTTPSPSPIPSRTAVPSFTSTVTATPTPVWTNTHTPTVTITSTYAILRGQVLELSNCRYGPGAPYLYKYALIEGSNLEVIGRNDLGTWILVQAIGGTNPCWVKASLMEVKGDVMAVAPTEIPLPASPYYAPLSGVNAIREGEEVVISWKAVALRAGDETASPPYLVEAWLCTNGRLEFTPVGSYTATVRLKDEVGCQEASHGRVYLVEKHGYTKPAEVPWP
jgi:hypothetical protein